MYPSFRLFTNQMKISIGLFKIGIFIFCLLKTFIYHPKNKKSKLIGELYQPHSSLAQSQFLEIMAAENDQRFMLIFHQPF